GPCSRPGGSMVRVRRRAGRHALVFVSVCAVVAPSLAPLAAARAAPASPAVKPAAARDVDGGWPRDYVTSTGAIRIFQPQVASWDGQQHIVAYAAVSYTAEGATKPVLGTVKLEADTAVAVSERLVNFSRVKLTETHFQDLPDNQRRDIAGRIQALMPQDAMIIALDRVLARLDKSQIMPKNVEGVKADPPVIFYSTSPALLVNVDGEPVWSPIAENDLKFAVNTNWDLFEHGPTNTLYLRNGDSWLSTADINGPWKPAGKLTDSFGRLPADDNWKEVKAALPGRATTSAPKVFVSTKPAELIVVHGAPAYQAVSGTGLLWVSNTESDVFRVGKSGPVFLLVSGRWFSAPDFTGPWTFATPTLPDDFRNIPI